MRRYLLRRALLAPVQVLGLALVSFLLLALAPGDPAKHVARQRYAGQEPPQEVVLAIRADLRLDDPLPVRFGNWLAGVRHGDLGASYRTGRPVVQDLRDRLGPTLLLAATSLTLAVAAGVPLGVLSALRPHSRIAGVVRGADRKSTRLNSSH